MRQSARPPPRLFAFIGLASLVALWEIGARIGGPLVLPTPAATAHRIIDLAREGEIWVPAWVTTLHVAAGFTLGAGTGATLGLLGGALRRAGAAFEAVSTITLGVPPIVWIVLALLWFGPHGIVPIVTVATGVASVVFAGTFAGMRAARPEFDALATAFAAPWHQRLIEVRLPQVAIALGPALGSALGFAWKMALMAEVLADGGGLGGRIADARADLAITDVFAWVVIALILLMMSDRLLARLARLLAA